MNLVFTTIVAALLCLALGAQAQAQAPLDNCEAIKQQIADRYRAGGVPSPALVVVAASSPVSGRVVGSCGNGGRRIVFVGARPAAGAAPTTPTTPTTAATLSAAPTPPTATAARDRIPTECKDGSIVIGPNCDDPRAPRMTSADLAASAELAAGVAAAPATVDAAAAAASAGTAAAAASAGAAAATPPVPPASR